MDVNPYQPPHEPDQLQKKQAVKRAIGVATILILTPVAVLIAAGASCTAAILIADTSQVVGQDAAIIVALAVFIVPPVLVLIAMICWAIRAALRPKH